VAFSREELVWPLRCLNKIVSGPDATTPEEIKRLTGATEEQLVALRERIQNEVTPPPKLGDRQVVIRTAGVRIGPDYPGPFFVEEWNGTEWRQIGVAADRQDLARFGCEPPIIPSR
jgi:hypothetical protein